MAGELAVVVEQGCEPGQLGLQHGVGPVLAGHVVLVVVLVVVVLVAELVVAQSLGQFGGVGGLDEVQVVDPGRRGGGGSMSGRALRWTWRPIRCGIAGPMARPW